MNSILLELNTVSFVCVSVVVWSCTEVRARFTCLILAGCSSDACLWFRFIDFDKFLIDLNKYQVSCEMISAGIVFTWCSIPLWTDAYRATFYLSHCSYTPIPLFPSCDHLDFNDFVNKLYRRVHVSIDRKQRLLRSPFDNSGFFVLSHLRQNKQPEIRCNRPAISGTQKCCRTITYYVNKFLEIGKKTHNNNKNDIRIT